MHRSIFANGLGQNAGMQRLPATRIVLAAMAAVAASPVAADGWEFGGHAKYLYGYTDYRPADLAAVVGEDPANDHALDLRLKADWRQHGFDFSIHYEVLGLAGDSVATRRILSGLGLPASRTASGLPDDRERLFDLTDDFIDEPRAVAVHRLDRLSIGYGTGTWTARFGRQAVSWGNGLAFQVLDFVNPFSPIAIDKDYKTGEDMLYGQWQPSTWGDVQLMLLPRRDPQTRELDHERASHAIKLHTRVFEFDLDALLARHFDQTLTGVGMVRSIGGAVWRFDALHTDVPDRHGVWSFVTNIDWSWVLFGKNMYGFAEYFRNGFGTVRESDLLFLDPELTARLARGELYALGRDNAALGLQVELMPLLNVFGTLIQNLNDGSRIVQLRGAWDAYENLVLMAGVNLPDGERGTEYGGIPTRLPGAYVASGRTLFLRAAFYF